MNRISKLFFCGGVVVLSSGWGFFAHQKINRLAVFILPPEMVGFYKRNIQYITETAVNPDRRRYAVPQEAPRHFIDLDEYGDSASFKLPRYWKDALVKWSEDSLASHGILPWHIYRVFGNLKDAMMIKDPQQILRLSAELGHYVADAHVPLHTTGNYDGQKTGQPGIHAFWESRLPELYFDGYDCFVGKAQYIRNVQLAAWAAIASSNLAVDSVLKLEKMLSGNSGDKKFSFETNGKRTIKVVSADYAKAYNHLLHGMVERRFRASIKMIGDIWYTAWVEAGQPDLNELTDYQPTKEELAKRKEELKSWKKKIYEVRSHESEAE